MSTPSATARRTTEPISTPAIERPEPVPMPPASSAMAKAGRPNFSLSRAATRPTTPGCQPWAAVTTTAPFSSTPRAAIASASASATVAAFDDLALTVEPIEFETAWVPVRARPASAADLLQCADDHPFVGLEPLGDHPQAVVLERPRRDPAVLDLVLGIEHVDVLQPLVRRHGPVDDQERRVGGGRSAGGSARTSRARAAGFLPAARGSRRLRAS